MKSKMKHEFRENILEYLLFPGHKILFHTVLPVLHMRRNIPATDGKVLSLTVYRTCAEYFNTLPKNV